VDFSKTRGARTTATFEGCYVQAQHLHGDDGKTGLSFDEKNRAQSVSATAVLGGTVETIGSLLHYQACG
jgi:hypothetical protein